MTALALMLRWPLILAMQTASEFSRTMERHAMTSGQHSMSDVALVALGTIIVVATTAYTVLYLVRPGETAAGHIKRRILDDDGWRPR